MAILKASIDLGTNTCLLLVAKWDEEHRQVVDVVRDVLTVVRLGEGVDQARMLQSAPIERVVQCLKKYSQIVKDAGFLPQDVICVATSQARDAKNSSEFFSRVQAESGFQFQTLTGDEEAKYTFLGALLPGLDPAQTAVIDIGGGSTEISTLDWAQSVDLGSVRLKERYFKSDPGSESDFQNAMAVIDQSLPVFQEYLKRGQKSYDLLAVAGTATSLAAWHLNLTRFDAAKIDQTVLTQKDVHQMMVRLKGLSVAEIQKLPLMDPMRADVILAGTMILWRTMQVLGFKKCRVSSRGLRFGVLGLR